MDGWMDGRAEWTNNDEIYDRLATSVDRRSTAPYTRAYALY